MPIIKSSMKDLRRTESRPARNRVALGKLRSNLKHSRTAIAAGDADAAGREMRGHLLSARAAAAHVVGGGETGDMTKVVENNLNRKE